MKTESKVALGTGLSIFLVVVGLTVLQRGFLNQGYALTTLIGIALSTGSIFWGLSPQDQNEFNFTQLGVKLVGGAATGASFMAVGWFLVKPSDPYIVVPFPREIPAETNGVASEVKLSINSADRISGLAEASFGQTRYFVVRFRQGEDSGEISVRFLGDDLSVQSRTYELSRVAKNIRRVEQKHD